MSVPLATLMLLLSVAVPIVERADLVADAVAESDHDPASCPPPHDHTVCTQVGANHAAGARIPVEVPIESAYRISVSDRSPAAGLGVRVLDAPARAPPQA